ncbi:hypothetical protein AYO38_06965 [bacterium SCGC AG-212-C10]|nr:hypothetical protein AYO38_06965 [bacterium SCGC AG-212-C10]
MRPMTPDDLYAIKWPGACDLSPDGKRVAVTITKLDRETDGYRSAIWVTSTDGSAEPWQFTAGAKRDSAPKWSPDGRSLAFLTERGEDKPQLAIMSASGGESRVLTKLPFGAGEPAWSPDSKYIAFAARTGTPPDPDPKKAKPYRRISSLKYRLNGEGFTYDRRRHLFVVELASGACTQITDGEWDDNQPAWSPDGTEIVFASARHADRDFDTWNDLWIVAATGGEPRKLTATKIAAAGPSWSPDGATIAFIGRDQNPGNHHLWTIPAAGGELTRVDPELDRNLGSAGADTAPPVWMPDGSLLTVAEDHGENTLIRVRPGSGTEWLARRPRQVRAFSAAGDKVALVTNAVSSPGELSLLDLSCGDEQQLTQCNEQWASEIALSAAEKFTVPTGEGAAVDCWIMKPQGFVEGETYPVLLNIHGGPFAQFGETFLDEFHVYTGAGYGVVFCNPRGGSGQDTAFARALIGRYGEPDYHDVMVAFEAALTRMPWADQSRLGVMGGSYGGFMTSWIIGHTRRFQAAISERAVNDWYGMQGNSDIGSYFNPSQLGEHAMLHDDLAAVLRQSPLTYATSIHTPVLILHSEDDLRCPIEQAEQLFTVLKLLRRDVEFVRFPDESHELSRSGRPSHRVDRFNVILDYFARKLPPAAPADGDS